MKWTSPDPPLRYELVRLVEVVAIVGDHHAGAHNLGAAGDLVASKHHLHLQNSHLVKLKTRSELVKLRTRLHQPRFVWLCQTSLEAVSDSPSWNMSKVVI